MRQILRTYNYNMKPIRRANGYTKKVKKYKRLFIIEKLKKSLQIILYQIKIKFYDFLPWYEIVYDNDVYDNDVFCVYYDDVFDVCVLYV